MATTVKIVLRKDKVNEQGKNPLYIRLTKNRRASYITTGISLESKYWDDKKCKVKAGYHNSVRMNNSLEKLRLEYEDRMLKEESNNTKLSAKALKAKVNGSNIQSFFEVVKGLLAKYWATDKVGTHDKCCSIVNKLKKYHGSENLALLDITPIFLRSYELYLRTNLGNKTNTVNKDMRFIRRVFNEAYRLDMIEHKEIPFRKYKLTTEKTVRAYLDEAELDAFEEVDCSSGKKYELHRDMYVFASYTGGMRISDVLLLQRKNYDGVRINFTIKKTGSQHSIKLPQKSLAILNKYVPEGDRGESFIFPALPDNLDMTDPVAVDYAISKATAYINKNLKAICKKAGINKKISFHCSRHGFATMALRKGISVDKVQHLLRHANIRETMIYAKVVNEDLDRAMEVFDK